MEEDDLRKKIEQLEEENKTIREDAKRLEKLAAEKLLDANKTLENALDIAENAKKAYKKALDMREQMDKEKNTMNYTDDSIVTSVDEETGESNDNTHSSELTDSHLRNLMNDVISRLPADKPLLLMKSMAFAALSDPKNLYKTTTLNQHIFVWLYQKFVESISKSDDAPSFATDSKNYHIPTKAEIFYHTISCIRNNIDRTIEIPPYIDQSILDPYFEFVDSMFLSILPTADKITTLVQNAETIQEFENLVPDSTLVMYKNKVPKFIDDFENHIHSSERETFNNIILANKNGLVIWVSKTFDDDSTMYGDGKIDLSAFLKSIKVNENHEIKINIGDDSNDMLDDSMKITIDDSTIKFYVVGRIRHWRIMKDSFRYDKDDFDRKIMMVTGLTNLHLLWDKYQKQPTINF